MVSADAVGIVCKVERVILADWSRCVGSVECGF